MVKGYFEKDETKKKELEEKMKNEVAPAFLKNMTTPFIMLKVSLQTCNLFNILFNHT